MRMHSLPIFLAAALCSANGDDILVSDRCMELCDTLKICKGGISTCDSGKGICSNLFYAGDGSIMYGMGPVPTSVRCPMNFDRYSWYLDVADAFEAIHRSTTMLGAGYDDFHNAVIVSRTEEVEFMRLTILRTGQSRLMNTFNDMETIYTKYNKLRKEKHEKKAVDLIELEYLRNTLSAFRDRDRMSYLVVQPGSL